jgi:uncharacterized HAD superfamily protein
MNYRSVADLAATVRANLHKIPAGTDLIVGVPRSGMFAGTLVGLLLNLPVVDLESFIANSEIMGGERFAASRAAMRFPREAKQPLIMDDSIARGHALIRVRQRLAESGWDRPIPFAVVYAAPQNRTEVDVWLDLVPYPRAFEWNLMHLPLITECCVDIDGVLCLDPREEENDDAGAYLKFLQSANSLVLPTFEIGHLVTSRLEKYRAPTEDWMSRHGVKFRHLHMLNLPNAEARKRAAAHGAFKAEVYKAQKDSPLFIESERHQAVEIAHRSGKPVLCFSTQELITPDVSLQRLQADGRRLRGKIVKRLRRILKLT